MNANIKRPNPYVGPRPFKTGETLYGRDGELHDLSNLLIAGRIVLLYSPSGAGKSSLVQAGLIPKLLERGLFVHPTIRLSLDIPERVAREGTEINRYLLSTLLSLEGALEGEKRIPMQELPGMSLDEYLRSARERRLAENSADQKSQEAQVEFGEVLIFDQFEEVLTLDPTDQASKGAFFQQVGEALRDRKRWALFVLREDFLAGLDPYLLAIPTRFSSSFRLDFLGTAAARQAIQEPAKSAGVEFADQAAGKLADDLRWVKVQQPDGTLIEQLGPYIEPVQLQVVCSNLWDKLEPESLEITSSDLAEIGDVDQSLGEYYASKVQMVALSTQVPERAIREWFENKLITEQGFRGQVLMGQEQSEGLDNRVIRELVDTHLVRAEKRRGLTWYELTHDRLIEPLRTDNQGWFDAKLSLLQRQASLWQHNRQADHLLLRDEKLKEAETWAAMHEAELTQDDRDFLKASLESQQLRDQAVEAEERVRKTRNLRRLLITALLATILAVFLMMNAIFARQSAVSAQGTAIYNATLANYAAEAASTAANQAAIERSTAEAASTLAVQQKSTADFYATQANLDATRQVGDAQAQATIQVGEASGRLLAAQALSYLENRPDLSSLLAIEAYNASHLWETKNVLLSNIQLSLDQSIELYDKPVPREDNYLVSIALSSDAKHIAWGYTNGRYILWNYDTDKEEGYYRLGKSCEVRGLGFSHDGNKLVAIGGRGGGIELRDVFSGEQAVIKECLPGEVDEKDWVLSAAFNPKDNVILAAGVGTSIKIFDVSTKKVIKTLDLDPRFSGVIYSVAWSPDGEKLAYYDYNGKIHIWEVEANKSHTLPGEIKSVINDLAWSPDGQWLASAHWDGKVLLWDVINESQKAAPESLHGKTFVYSVSFSNDGKLLASAGGDNSIVIWKVPDMKLFVRLNNEQKAAFRSVAFIPENNLGLSLLASASYDNQIRIFEVLSQQPLSSKEAESTGNTIIALATSGDAQQPINAILKDDKLLVTGLAQPLGENVSSAAFNSQGTMLAVGQADGKILLFDPGSGELIRSLEGSQKPILSLAFNAQGDMLVASTCENEDLQVQSRPTCAESVLQFWDLESERSLFSLTAQSDFIRALAFYPQGDTVRLATGSDDGSLKLWTPLTRDPQAQGISLARFTSAVTSLAFSPDGQLMASGLQDSTLNLWDTEDITTTNPKPIGAPLLGSPSSIHSLVFSPDSQKVYSADERGGILAWDVSLKSWIERNCALAKRNLSEDEWAQYLPNKTYPSSAEEMTCPKN